MSHQTAEPKKTPSTIVVAEELLVVVAPNPNPAKIAMKESIVVGLVTVKKKVLIKLLNSPLLLLLAAFSAGFDTTVFTPIKTKNNPPINCSQNVCVSRKEEMAVNPKPATTP